MRRMLAIVAAGVIVLSGGAAPVLATAPDQVAGWGANDAGQATPPAGLTGVTAIAAGGYHSLALLGDGTVVAWGSNSQNQSAVPTGLTGVVAIAAGLYHSLALRSDGTVVGWGANAFGQAAPPAGLSDAVAIGAGTYHSVALRRDGTVVAWGNDGYGQTDVPAGLSGVVAVAAGGFHSLALKADGTVIGWGWNAAGQAAPPPGLTGVTHIAAGGTHSLALKADGTVVAWGADNLGQSAVPAGLAGVTAIAAGAYHSLAVRSDGTVVAWGWDGFGQVDVPAGLSGVTSIAAGHSHSLALRGGDTTAPQIAITSPVGGATYTVDEPATAAYACTDEPGGSGVASCIGSVDGAPVASGGPLPTGVPGTHVLLVTATDEAGNGASASASYVVLASFGDGGSRVVPGAVNATIKAGAMVPIRFGLGGDHGMAVFAAGSPSWQQATCDTWAAMGTPLTAPVRLAYDATTGQYNYRWKTDRAWAGQCWRVTMQFGPDAGDFAGGLVTLDFRFEK